MDFHGINASVRTGIYSMIPLTPAFPAREIINVSSSAAAAYAGPRAWDGKTASGDETNTGESFPRYSFMQL